MNESPPPDATRTFSLFRNLNKGENQTAEETHELVELIRDMASTNLVTQLGTKIDTTNAHLVSMEKSQNAKLDAQRDVLDARYRGIIWTIGTVGGALGVLITVALFVLG